jgi:hypothetical protein
VGPTLFLWRVIFWCATEITYFCGAPSLVRHRYYFCGVLVAGAPQNCIPSIRAFLLVSPSPGITHKNKKKNRNFNHITCFKCKQKGHYSNLCPEKSSSMTVMNGGDQRGSKFKEKTQSGVANWKRVFSAIGCNKC